ncbi:PfL30 [Candidatus Micrarchaeum sp.]|jgi:large subunit ribosomal protein L30|uniref:uL30 family ribosomal protein n=1 Tax=Candidatus Micrarchaeum sp. TaxID=2282148 RepID=UPI000AFFF664|nr:uL30 family ribosomal protein [Candidatus Micrarchaeum sp.]QRF74438.1 PfL30 [Candidatus Micrarchaeum sp.]
MSKSVINKLVGVVRIRGTVNVRHDTAETLKRLRLKRVNNCTILKVSKDYEGMLKTCNNYVAYGELDEEVLDKLLKKAGAEADAKKVASGEYDMKKLKELMPVRLHPPTHGYKSTKLGYKQGGDLGYMGSDINKLIKRMI